MVWSHRHCAASGSVSESTPLPSCDAPDDSGMRPSPAQLTRQCAGLYDGQQLHANRNAAQYSHVLENDLHGAVTVSSLPQTAGISGIRRMLCCSTCIRSKSCKTAATLQDCQSGLNAEDVMCLDLPTRCMILRASSSCGGICRP